MKYFDVVANRRACLRRDVKAISPKPPELQTANGTAIYWGHDVIECKHRRVTISWCSSCVEDSSLRRKAEPIRTFSVSLSSFFPTYIAFIRCRS